MHVESTRLGGLACQVVDWNQTDAAPQLAVVLCHGYGAPGTDLVPLGPELFELHPGLRGKVRFVFPQAPLSLAAQGMPGGRAWWHLDVMRLMMSIETGNFGEFRENSPAGLPDARQLLTSLVDELCGSTGLAPNRVVLGGFSQGSMLATDVSLRLPEAPGALCVFSGTVICESEWRALAASRGRLRIVQSHGYQDPILPYQGAEWLRDLFLESGFDVDFVPFPGMHSIPFEALHRFASLLGDLVNG